MRLSSIFNFESLQGFSPHFPATLLAVLGVVGALELGSRLIPENWLLSTREMAQMDRVLLPRYKQPAVVFLGSSRIRFAVVPKLLDGELGLEANSTINLGLSGGRTYDALYYYEQHREMFKHAKLVVLAVDEWFLSSGYRQGSVYYRLHAPLAERLRFSEPARGTLLLDGLFTFRLKLNLLPLACANHLGYSVKLDRYDSNNQFVFEHNAGVAEKFAQRTYDNLLEAFYEDFRISPVMEGHIAALASMAREDGARFVIVQTPNRSAYQMERDRLHWFEYRQHICGLQRVAKTLGVPLYLFENPADCGLNEASFYDYGHMTPEGARTFTRRLGQIIKDDGLMK